MAVMIGLRPAGRCRRNGAELPSRCTSTVLAGARSGTSTAVVSSTYMAPDAVSETVSPSWPPCVVTVSISQARGMPWTSCRNAVTSA